MLLNILLRPMVHNKVQQAGELKTKQTNYCTNSVMSTYKEFKEVLSEK
jgi:hypothetical protein